MEREPYVPKPKTKEQIREEKKEFWEMIASVIIVFAFYIWIATQI